MAQAREGLGCAGPTHDQAVWDYAIRGNGVEAGRRQRIGSEWLKGGYNLCQNWTDEVYLRNEISEKWSRGGGWARIPIELVGNWPVYSKQEEVVCAHVFAVPGAENRLDTVENWYHESRKKWGRGKEKDEEVVAPESSSSSKSQSSWVEAIIKPPLKKISR